MKKLEGVLFFRGIIITRKKKSRKIRSDVLFSLDGSNPTDLTIRDYSKRWFDLIPSVSYLQQRTVGDWYSFAMMKTLLNFEAWV